MYGVARPVGLEREEAEARALFEAFLPAVRLALTLGVPFDATRDVLVGALLDAAQRRHADLPTLALALGRTTRSIRMLRRSDPCTQPRGENLVRRAEEALAEPLTRGELGSALPAMDGFDAAKVALAALLRAGRVVPQADRAGPTRWRRIGPPPPVHPPEPDGRRLGRTRRHLRAVGQAMRSALSGAPAHTTEAVRTSPAQMDRVVAEVQAFIEARVATMEARAGAAGVPCTIYFGAAPMCDADI